MSYSYDAAGVNNKDTVRFLLQDTDMNEPFLSNEEINYMISRWLPIQNTLEYVAAACADVIAARYAREATISADGVNVSLSQIAQQFRDLAMNLRQQHKNLLVGGLPDVGGISPYEETHPEIAAFNFGTGMHDDLEAGRQEYGSRNLTYYDPYNEPGV